MTREEYRAAAENVIYLAACMVNGDRPDPGRAAGMDLRQLHEFADFHMLTGIVGYALEAASAAVDYAREQLGARCVFAQCDSENEASYRLMERLGMRRVSCLGGRKNRSTGDMERFELTYEVEIG